MKYLFKVLLFCVFATSIGTGLALYVTERWQYDFVSALEKHCVDNGEFSDNVINTSVLIYTIDSENNLPMGHGSGGIIKHRYCREHVKLYILSCAHILRDNANYNGTMVLVKNGTFLEPISFPIYPTKYIDTQNDLVLFEATIDRNIPIIFYTNRPDVYHLPPFKRQVATSGFPFGVGPIYDEGIVGVSLKNFVLCRIASHSGGSGSVVYDIETQKIIGVVRFIFKDSDNNSESLPNIVGLISGQTVKKFLDSIEILY